MSKEDQIDFSTLLPSKQRMIWTAVGIVVPLLLVGLLLGVLVHNAPDGALATALGDAFLAGSSSAFRGPGGEVLALKAGVVWAACLGFLIGPFIFMAWLLYRVHKEYRRLQDEKRMEEYRRIVTKKAPK